MSEKNYITPPGLERLRKELEALLREERPKVVATVAWAASNGDRSENADYIYGKRRLREIDRRIRFLTQRIEAAEVVAPGSQGLDRIYFGARVHLDDEDSGERWIQIVGEDESEPAQGRISWKSPLAKALLGKRAGDEVQVKKPKGPCWIEILAFDFQDLPRDKGKTK